MLSPNGQLLGDLSVARLGADRFWLVGSYYLQEWHLRWFRDHLPPAGVRLENLSESWLGFSLSGPRARDILARLTRADISNEAFSFLGVLDMDVGIARAVVARVSLTGELGYEINVPASMQGTLWTMLLEVGTDFGLKPIGMRAQDSLRLEKGYGVWSLEFAQSYTPAMSGLDRFIAFDKGDFIGRAAALKERERGPVRRLVLLSVDSADADVTGYEPVRSGDRVVGFVTSGAYGHHVRQSLALAYIDATLAEQTSAPLSVDVVGEPRAARLLREPLYDPRGLRLRS